MLTFFSMFYPLFFSVFNQTSLISHMSIYKDKWYRGLPHTKVNKSHLASYISHDVREKKKKRKATWVYCCHRVLVGEGSIQKQANKNYFDLSQKKYNVSMQIWIFIYETKTTKRHSSPCREYISKKEPVMLSINCSLNTLISISKKKKKGEKMANLHPFFFFFFLINNSK